MAQPHLAVITSSTPAWQAQSETLDVVSSASRGSLCGCNLGVGYKKQPRYHTWKGGSHHLLSAVPLLSAYQAAINCLCAFLLQALLRLHAYWACAMASGLVSICALKRLLWFDHKSVMSQQAHLLRQPAHWQASMTTAATDLMVFALLGRMKGGSWLVPRCHGDVWWLQSCLQCQRLQQSCRRLQALIPAASKFVSSPFPEQSSSRQHHKPRIRSVLSCYVHPKTYCRLHCSEVSLEVMAACLLIGPVQGRVCIIWSSPLAGCMLQQSC